MEKIYTKNAPEPVGPYSQAIKVNGFLYCSGQIAINPETNAVEAMKKFVNYKKDVEAAIQKAVQSAVGAGFLGGQQESSLIQTMKKLQDKMSSSMDTITNEMNTAITKTVEVYKDQEGRISNVFEEFGSQIGDFVSGAVDAVVDLFDFE